MLCPLCSSDDTAVINSRLRDGKTVRRRQCKACGERFSTIEQLLPPEVQERVAKRTPKVHGVKIRRKQRELRVQKQARSVDVRRKLEDLTYAAEDDDVYDDTSDRFRDSLQQGILPVETYD
jgi:transcriptional regulator NrdR family protein